MLLTHSIIKTLCFHILRNSEEIKVLSVHQPSRGSVNPSAALKPQFCCLEESQHFDLHFILFFFNVTMS